MNKRKWIIVILGAVSILILSSLVMLGLASMKPTPAKMPHKEVIRFVKAEPITYENITTTVLAKGRLKSKSEITVNAEASGEILEGDIPFKKGQSFKKGDLLVKINDDDDLLSQKAKKSTFLNRIASVLPEFKINYTESYDGWVAFFESISIDKDLPELPEINSTQEKVLLESKSLLSDYYTIKSQEIVLKRYSIYAPFDGTIIEVSKEVGVVVNAGTMLGQIINTKEMELEVPVELGNAIWLNNGDNVKVMDEYGVAEWNGKIVRKSKNVDPQTQSVSVFVALKSTSSKPLYKGQYLTAKFSGIKLKNVMELPRNAVFNSNSVFLVQDSVLVKREIKINKINRNTLFFTGIEAGEMIVVEPLINASENTRVKIFREENEAEIAADDSTAARI